MALNNPRLDAPAIYAIRVAGELDDGWSDRLGGLAITACEGGNQPETLLYGRLSDQAALMGVINALYDYHYVLISVERLSAD